MASTMEFFNCNIQVQTRSKLVFSFAEFSIDGMDQNLDSIEYFEVYFTPLLPEFIETIEYVDELEIKVNGIDYTIQSEIGYWASDYHVSGLCDAALTKAIVKWFSNKISDSVTKQIFLYD